MTYRTTNPDVAKAASSFFTENVEKEDVGFALQSVVFNEIRNRTYSPEEMLGLLKVIEFNIINKCIKPREAQALYNIQISSEGQF